MSNLEEEILNSYKGILHWNFRNFREIPQILFNDNYSVKDLYLKGNQIQTLPNQWQGFKHTLEQLHLDGNLIENVDEESLSEIENLIVLNLSKNSISSFNFKKLSNLTHLNLSANGLKGQLCDSIGNYTVKSQFN